MKKMNLTIKGMHCSSCSMLIADELKDLGVKESRIDHASGKATITFDESKVKEDSIKKTIKKLGYEVAQ